LKKLWQLSVFKRDTRAGRYFSTNRDCGFLGGSVSAQCGSSSEKSEVSVDVDGVTPPVTAAAAAHPVNISAGGK